MAACGMGRSWVYYRLREHARPGAPCRPRAGRGGPCGRTTAVRRATLARAGRPVGRAARAVTASDRPSVHGLARACARRDAHGPWTWTWTITNRHHGRG